MIFNCESTTKRIIVYSLNDSDMLMLLLRCIAEEGICDVEVWSSLDVANIEKLDISFYRHISKGEMDELISNYLRYEFTNRLLLVSDNSNYPNLYNFVTTGVLSKEEYIQALLMENSYE